MSRPKAALLRVTAFDSEQLAHLPFMKLFSSGEFPSVVAARRCSSCAFSFDVGQMWMPATMIVGRGEAKALATKQKASRAITKRELSYLLSKLALLTQLPCKFAS